MAQANQIRLLRTPSEIFKDFQLLSLPILVSLLSLVSAETLRANGTTPPRFEDYPVQEIYSGVPKKINFRNNPNARKYRTVLKDGLQEGKANFAGHYRLVEWGCGSNCHHFALIDMKNGNVYFLKFGAALEIEYKVNSALLITDPPKALFEVYGDESPKDRLYYSSYYFWDEKKKELVTLIDGYK